MEKKTGEMFLKTCQYLSFLLDDPKMLDVCQVDDMALVVSDLMVKLSGFIQHLNGGFPVTAPALAYRSSALDQSGTPGSVDMNDRTCLYLRSAGNEAFPSRKNGDMDKGNYTHQPQNHAAGSHLLPHRVSGQSNVRREMDPTCSLVSALQSVPPQSPKRSAEKATVSVKHDFPYEGQSVDAKTEHTEVNSNRKLNYYFGYFLTKVFRSHTEAIRDGLLRPIDMGIYCRVCDQVIFDTWCEHEKTYFHMSKSSHLKKLKMYTCFLCKIFIFGSEELVLKYFEYHFLLIHQGKTKKRWKEVMIEVGTSGSDSMSIVSSVESISDSSAKSDLKKKRRRKAKKLLGSVDSISSKKDSDPQSPALAHSDDRSKASGNPPGLKTVLGVPIASPFTKPLESDGAPTNKTATGVGKPFNSPSAAKKNVANVPPTAKKKVANAPTTINKNVANAPYTTNNAANASSTSKKNVDNAPSTSNKNVPNAPSTTNNAANASSTSKKNVADAPSTTNKNVANTPSTSKKNVANTPPTNNKNVTNVNVAVNDSSATKNNVINLKINNPPTYSKEAADKQPVPRSEGVNTLVFSSSVSAKNEKPSNKLKDANAGGEGRACAAENGPTDSSELGDLPPSPFPELDLLLIHRLEQYRKTSIPIDMGFCTVCRKGLTSAFEIMSHEMDHESQSDKWTEEMCPHCHFKVFGSDHRKYFDLPHHRQSCKLLSRPVKR